MRRQLASLLLGISACFALIVGCVSGGGGGFSPHLDAAVTGNDGGSSCQAPKVSCSGVCVNVLTDANNCGGCGQPCNPGDKCISAVCQSNTMCTGGTICNGQCLDTQNDPRNCGRCSNQCASGMCSGGTCVMAGCPGAQKMCNGSCTDTQNDPFNCGLCNRTCSSGLCNFGTCSGGGNPDMAMGGLTGCNGELQCLNNCTAGDTTCTMACQNGTTPTGRSLFNSLVSCVFMTACPNTGGGICDSTAAGFNSTNCDSCISMAQMVGGKCYSQIQSCLNNKP